MVEDIRYWHSKAIYLKNVTGEYIVKKQNDINNDENKYVVASQIFPTSLKDDFKFNCFIYYKDKYGNVKGL